MLVRAWPLDVSGKGPELFGTTGGFDISAGFTPASHISAACQGAEYLTVWSWMRGSPKHCGTGGGGAGVV